MLAASGILHDYAFHDIRHMLTGIAALLQVRVNLPPCNDLNGVFLFCVELAHGINEQAVPLLFQGVYLNNQPVQCLGLLEVASITSFNAWQQRMITFVNATASGLMLCTLLM